MLFFTVGRRQGGRTNYNEKKATKIILNKKNLHVRTATLATKTKEITRTVEKKYLQILIPIIKLKTAEKRQGYTRKIVLLKLPTQAVVESGIPNS